jgi:hypothetical protein
MPQYLSVGVAAGLATALLFASASAGGMTGRFLLFFLAPLPSYLAGLGWGTMAAAIAATTSAAVASIFVGGRAGFVFFLSQGLPLVALCHLVLLNRPAQSALPLPMGSAPSVEWYPIGRVLAAAALMAGALALVSILLLGADLEGLRAMMRQLVDDVLVKQLPGLGGGEIGDKEKDALATLLLHALPAGSAVIWLGGFALNLWLGGKVTLLSGRLSRPWPDLQLMRFPSGFGLGLAGSLALSMLPGLPGLLATGFAGAFLFAYMLMGLAIIHFMTRGLPARPFILWGIYVVLIVFNTTAALVVALVAILEPLLWYRRPNPPDQSPPTPPPSPT